MDHPLQLASQLARHLKSLRKSRGLTQAQLGALIGVGQVRVAAIEKNPAAVSLDQLLKLLAALNAQLVLREAPPGSGDEAHASSGARGEW